MVLLLLFVVLLYIIHSILTQKVPNHQLHSISRYFYSNKRRRDEASGLFSASNREIVLLRRLEVKSWGILVEYCLFGRRESIISTRLHAVIQYLIACIISRNIFKIAIVNIQRATKLKCCAHKLQCRK